MSTHGTFATKNRFTFSLWQLLYLPFHIARGKKDTIAQRMQQVEET